MTTQPTRSPLPDPDAAQQPTRGRFCNVRMPLSYVEWARHGAPLAILIHGNRDHARSWDPIAVQLHRTHHVIAPDLRGHGDSDWSQDGRYNYAAYLSDLAALCETLRVTPDRPVTLVGHSLGAHVALRFAGARPDLVRSLVALEAVSAPTPIDVRRSAMAMDERLRSWFDERRETAAAQSRAFATITEAAERMLSKHGYLTRAQAQHLTRHGVRRRGGAWRWKYDPYVAVWPFPELDIDEAEALWRRVACPALLIFGERSWPSTTPARLVATLPDAREVRLADSGHWPQHDALDACLAAIIPFLETTGGAHATPVDA